MYHIGDQRRIRRACASAQSHKSLRCSQTWSMEVDEGPTKNQTSSPTGLLRMRVWRMSLRRTKSATLSTAGSFMFSVMLLRWIKVSRSLQGPMRTEWFNAYEPQQNLERGLYACKTTLWFITPVAQVIECPLRWTGCHGFDPGPRHTKVVKNGTSCSSLGPQTCGVEQGLVDTQSFYGKFLWMGTVSF